MEHQHISKGIYQYSQIGNFVSVKNYIFIRKDDKKQLLLRFSNDFDHVVDSMTYFVVQMDNFGKVLARTKVTDRDLAFRPGTLYVTDRPITVEEYCSDFKIVFAEVISGSYRYEVHSDTIAVHYIRTPERIADLSDMTRRERRKRKDHFIEEYSVDRKDFQERGVAAFVASIVVLLVLALNALSMFFTYFVSENPDAIRKFPYFGDLLDRAYGALSSVSRSLNFLSETETVLLFAGAFFVLFFVFLTVNHWMNERSVNAKRKFYKRKADDAQE